MQKEDLNKLYQVIPIHVSKQCMLKMNQHKSWKYGYNPKHDLVVISQDGTVGEIYNINGLLIGLPLQPKKIYKRSKKKEDQYWEAFP